MAIKGKGKSRSRRVVAAPPRPQLVARKRVLWERPLTWVVVGLVVVGAIAFGTSRKIHTDHVAAQKRAAAALLAREASAVGRFAAQVNANLPTDQQAQPDGSLIIFATLPTMLDQSAKGQLGAKAARTRFLNLAADATKNAKGMAKVDATTLINSQFSAGTTPAMKTPGLTQSLLNQAVLQMDQALNLYASIGNLAASAAGLPAGPREAVMTRAKELVTQAEAVFALGYNTVSQLEFTVGLASPSPPQLPQTAPPPTPSPSASPTKKAAATPTP